MISKTKILIGVIAIGIILAILWMGNTQTVDCSKIASSKNIETCVGTEITAVGTIQCQKPGVDRKAGVHYLIFNDKTEIKFLEEYTECNSIDGKKVKVIGNFYKCGMNDQQCGGVGLTNIESVTLTE